MVHIDQPRGLGYLRDPMIDMQSTHCEGGWLQKTPRVQTPELVELREHVVGHDNVPYHHILAASNGLGMLAVTTHLAIRACTICRQNALYIEKCTLLNGLYSSIRMSVIA